MFSRRTLLHTNQGHALLLLLSIKCKEGMDVDEEDGEEGDEEENDTDDSEEDDGNSHQGASCSRVDHQFVRDDAIILTLYDSFP
ncbi:hypothetical protein L6452_41844 [Arctium lappa]|uniref:Uncharacterized protein n=1 Tax=Arctium lappa TaxID=4217 RepID=A0ACB8XGU3_ARCLA|nr:hypothetical protein L6452_41844 [Arctium lappa]